MTQAEITALLNTLPDEWIESAVSPQKREPVSLLRTVPAVAACMIVLIAAAVYPRMKGHTPPRVPETAAVTAETGTTEQTETVETGQDGPETEKISGTAISSGTASAAESGETAAPQTGLTGAATDSTGFSVTMTSRSTSRQLSTETTERTESGSRTASDSAVYETTIIYETLSDPDMTDESALSTDVVIPLYRWGGDIEESAAEMNTAYARFAMFTAETPDPVLAAAGLSDFDFSQYDCLVLHLQTNCEEIALTGIRTERNLTALTVSCLDAAAIREKYGVLYALAVPKSLNIQPENCRADFAHLTDREVFRSRVTNSLILELS